MNIQDIKIFHQHRVSQKRDDSRNDFVAQCYSVYLTGKSIRWIAKNTCEGKITHQALYSLFVVRRYRLRKKKKHMEKIYEGVTYRADSSGLYRSRSKGKTVYLHRFIYEQVFGKIPDGYYIIFHDGNKENVHVNNLQCLSSNDAKRMYNYANQFGYKRFQNKGAFGI